MKVERRLWMQIVVIATFVVFTIVPATGQTFAERPYVGIQGSLIKLVGGDQDDSQLRTWQGIHGGYFLNEKIGIGAEFGIGFVDVRDADAAALLNQIIPKPGAPYYRTYLTQLNVNGRYNITTLDKWVPYGTAGVGMVLWDLRDMSSRDPKDHLMPLLKNQSTEIRNGNNVALMLGAGAEWIFLNRMGLDLGLRYTMLMGQDEDISGWGDVNNGVFEIRAGLNFRFGKAKDTDGDGINDAEDADPLHAEDFDGFEDLDGAPDNDNDKDGVPDEFDGAPNDPEDIDDFEDEDGVPDLDNDKDGVLDKNDKAPNDPEDMDGFEDEDGAPDLDNDGDGIPDAKDKCPNQKETVNGFEDEDGCPDKAPQAKVEVKPEPAPVAVQVVEEEAPETEAYVVMDVIEVEKELNIQPLNFIVNGWILNATHKEYIDGVVKVLEDNPDVNVEIQGHTDNTGTRTINEWLSLKRAESVMKYMVESGIDAERLTAKGFAFDEPIASNDTVEGRLANRRVVFKILD